MTIDAGRIRSVVAAARGRGSPVLLETEGLELLGGLGIPAPAHVFVRAAEDVATADTHALVGDRVVVKVISPEILHKSDVGGVAAVANDRAAIAAAVADMQSRLGDRAIAGFTINQFARYDAGLGSELILGLRWTADFGAVVTLGAGGIYTEFLAGHFRPGREIGIFSADAGCPDDVREALGRLAAGRLATTSLRGQPPRIHPDALVDAVGRFTALAREFAPHDIVEAEINPLVVSGGRLLALDILVKLGNGEAPVRPARPLAKLRHLLEPRSAAVIGVSEKLNPGRIILNNLVREGFDTSRLYVVKPGTETIDGCRCVPDIASLPERVDLFILAVSAAQTPQAITEIVEGQRAESVIVIPGGPRGEGRHRGDRRAHAGVAGGSAREQLGGAAHQRRQLPGRPLAAGALRHDVHPRVQAAGAVGRGVARRLHLAERRVRGRADEQARGAQPEVRDHPRQPDGPDGRRLPRLPEGRSRPSTSSRSTSRGSARSTA